MVCGGDISDSLFVSIKMFGVKFWGLMIMRKQIWDFTYLIVSRCFSYSLIILNLAISSAFGVFVGILTSIN